jgi:hypothetical protein
MIEREYEALIQDLLDGQATPRDVERLEAWLASSDAGRTRRRELEGVFQILERVRSVEAPPDLRDRVLESLQTRAEARLSPGERGGARIRPPRTLFGYRVKLAYVLAAGIAAGAVGLGALTGVLRTTGPGRDPSISGSMMPAVPPASGAVRLALSAGEARMEAVTWRVGKARLVAVVLRGGEPAGIELQFDPGSLSVGAVRQGRYPLPLASEAGKLVFQTQIGGDYMLEFTEHEPEAAIQVILRVGHLSTAGVLAAPGGAAPAR